jgi:hypothetical protein
MPQSHVNSRKPATVALALLALLLVSLGLAACGSSSSSSSSTTATTSASTGTGAKGPNAGRFAAVRECLQKEGITLPKRTPGQKRPPGGAGGFLGGGGAGGAAGPQLPKGVTRAKYEAALKKCGGSTFGHGGATRFDSPTFKAALAKFATCMRQNGVNVPAPNTSGSGPVFDTKGIDTSSAQFKAAEAKCKSDLSGAFKRGPGAGGGAGGVPGTNGAPAGAAPPSSGEAPGGAAGPPPAG